jgi:hypothetical protein
MTTPEMFERNEQRSTELDLYLLDHPEVADEIPDGALVVFVPAFDKELARRNRALARKSRAPGQSVVYVQVARMGASRLDGLTLKVACARLAVAWAGLPNQRRRGKYRENPHMTVTCWPPRKYLLALLCATILCRWPTGACADDAERVRRIHDSSNRLVGTIERLSDGSERVYDRNGRYLVGDRNE